MKRLRIGVNALYLIPGCVGGTEIYLRNLLRALARVDNENEYVVFTNRETGADLVPQRANFKNAPQPVNAVNRPSRLIYEQFKLPNQLNRIDCLLNPGFTCPAVARCPNVTVFHDLQHKRLPSHFARVDRLGWNFFLYWSAKRSKRFIAVSESTARDLEHFYHVARERIHVVPHGVEPEFLELGNTARNPEKMILCVSTLHPHKNLGRLLRAFARFNELRPGYRLVLAGMRGFYAEEVEKLIDELGIRDFVEVTGWIARERLIDVYKRAAIFVYPSTFEGFGMPVLEALAAGIPTACSAIEPLRGLAGDAALFFSPWDQGSLTSALLYLADNCDVREQLASAGRRRAAGQTWEVAAEKTLAAIRAATTEVKRSTSS